MGEFAIKKPSILVVEDDVHSRAFMESSLELSGFKVLSAGSAEEALELCRQVGISSISAVLSDYRLPKQNGIELVNWIRSIDPVVSALIVTGQGEKNIVQQSITAGVFQYLEKPVTHQELREILWKAVEQTRRQRKYAADQLELKALEHFDQSLNVVLPETLESRIQVFYKPLHEVGGDFLISHDFGDGEWVLLVGDVSGHDMRSGYVSTYFQGMFRGCIESGGRIENALELFNRTLRHQGIQSASQTDLVSLSLSVIHVLGDEEIEHWNYGFTPCQKVTGFGTIKECPIGRFPLGWIDEIDTSPIRISETGNNWLYIFTDGLADFAESLNLNCFSLFYRFMHTINALEGLPAEPLDDILAIRYLIDPTMLPSQTFEPILSEHYAGTEVDHIDHLQSNWRRSITFVLDDRLGDRLYDLLICIREGMLNAFIHGCERSPEMFAHLQISLNEDKNLLRIHIDDPGRGHSFDLKKRLAEIREETGKHLGLGIIQHLSDEFHVENEGTSLIFDFEISPDKK